MGIKWAGQDYKVKLTDDPIGDPQNETRAILGQVEQDFNTIIIDGTLPKTRVAEVLMHELAHVAVGAPEFLTMEIGANMYGILAENGLLKSNFTDSVTDGKATKDEVERILRANEKALEPTPEMFRSTTVSDSPWDGDSGRFDIEEWGVSCLIHLDDQDVNLHASHKLPVKEPDGTISRNACHEAAALLAGSRGGVGASSFKARLAARRLVNIYVNDLVETPPESLKRAAGL
tara:strand:+ start:1448 stop:2143 length:696 start_codon:yes stop_codon:yes gene_type:complete